MWLTRQLLQFVVVPTHQDRPVKWIHLLSKVSRDPPRGGWVYQAPLESLDQLPK